MYSFFYYASSAPESYKAAVISADVSKIELFGDEYLFEFIKLYAQQEAYKIYVTDCLKLIAENTAKFGGGSVLNCRYYDLISPKKEVPEESADEIISRMKSKLAKFGGEG